MALYTIDHHCGHTTEQQIYGPNTNGQRERRAEYLASTVCPDCYRTQRRTTEEHAVAGLNLPELTGSDKQISWATDIRRRALAHVADQPDLITAARAHTAARWWIDHRDSALQDLAAEIPPTAADIQARQNYTQALLDTDTPTEVHDPHWRPRTGTSRPAPLHLAPDAARALRVWQTITAARATDVPPSLGGDLAAMLGPAAGSAIHQYLRPRDLDDDTIQRWISECDDPIAAELVAGAHSDAVARSPLPWTTLPDHAWHVACHLTTRHQQLRPRVLPPQPPQETHCHHDVPIADDCAACDAEI